MNKHWFIPFTILIASVCPSNADVLPENKQSRHFQAMHQHLDLGGVLYGYVEIDGDMEKLAEMGQEIFDAIRKINPRDFPLEVNFQRVLQATGLNGIKAIGASSYKDGEVYRNKVFLLAPGEKRGLLRIAGGKPHAFETWSFAPAGADVVFEQDLNAKAIYDVIMEVAQIVMDDEGPAVIEGTLMQPLPELGFKPMKIINDLDLKVSVVVDMQENRLLTIPDSPGNGIKMPLTDAVVKIDKMGWLIDHLAPLAAPEDGLRVFRDLQWEGIELTEEAPGDFKVYRPVLMKHLRTGSLVLATRQVFAQRCFSEKPTLAEDPKFKQAIEGLPRKGNGFAYVSTTLHETVNDVFEQIPPGEMGGMENVVQKLVSFVIPGKNGPEASVSVNLPEGFLTVANSGSSLKSDLASAIAVPMLNVGPLLLFSIRAPFSDDRVLDVPDFIEADEAIFLENNAEAIEIPIDEEDDPIEDIDQLLRELELPPPPVPDQKGNKGD